MDKKDTSQRLNELMSIYNLSQSDICRKTGITKSLVSLYVSGKRVPKQDNLYVISKAFNINPAWLMGLDVPMKPQESLEEKYSTENARLLIEIKNNGQLRDFIKDYIQLNDVNKSMVMTLVRSLLDSQKGNQ